MQCTSINCNKEARYTKGRYPGLCVNHYHLARYYANKDKWKANQKRYTKRLHEMEQSGSTPSALKNKRLRSGRNNLRYQCERVGITIEQREEQLKKQNNKCAVCGVDFNQLKRRPAIDHDHITGKFRGLLCTNCNTSLGLLKENREIILNLLSYLKEK